MTSIWRKVYLTAQEGAVHQEELGASEEEESGAPDSPTFAEAELEDFLSVETPTIEEDPEFDRLFEEIYDRILSIFERENLILPPNPLSSIMDIVNFVLVDDSDMSELIYIYDDLYLNGIQSIYFKEFDSTYVQEMLLFFSVGG